MIKIYCLVDPRNNRPFYVGATNCALNTRLSGHLTEAKYYHPNPYTIHLNLPALQKQRLIQDILNNGKKPRIRLLMEVPKITTNHYERFFYNTLKAQGYQLLQSEAFGYYEAKTNSRFNKPEYLQLIPVGKTLTTNNCKIIR